MGESTDTQIPSPDRLTSVDRYDSQIEEAVAVISKNMHEITGFLPAVDPEIKTHESRENHMDHAWTRDFSFNMLSLISAFEILRVTSPGRDILLDIQQTVKNGITKSLNFYNQKRWIKAFSQRIQEYNSHTEITEAAPEVHTKLDGTACEWDQNQPESWGEYLTAIALAHKSGIISAYTFDQTEFIKKMATYLINIKPWKFASAGMWEGKALAHSPSSRSTALAIAKGLDAVSSLFSDDQEFKKQITDTVDMTMEFVKNDISEDYTLHEEHPGKADLAMLVTMCAIPSTARTSIPFDEYLAQNKIQLDIGQHLGAKRFVGDVYYKAEKGEARWFMAEPILAMGFFDECEKSYFSGDLKKAHKYREEALRRLNRAISVIDKYGYPPELFMEIDPTNALDSDDIWQDQNSESNIVLKPLKRSLIWNITLMAAASAKAEKSTNWNLDQITEGRVDKAMPVAA